MKVAIVKQVLDLYGPWASLRWRDTDPRRIFERWPSKAFMWEMTCLLKADWYVIPQVLEYCYTRSAVFDHPGRKEAIERHTHNVIQPQEIPFDEYDVVISIDPILRIPAQSPTLFGYFMQEHWDELYRRSRKRPLSGYDLFFDHLLEVPGAFERLPQPIAFPYLRNPEVARSVFPAEKEETAWIDWRLLFTLAGSEQESRMAAARSRLEKRLGAQTVCASLANQSTYGFSDPPLWGDPARYLQAMARSKFYIGMGQIHGAGAALGDAASLGCLCIGDAQKAYHRLICHPDLLCRDLVDLPAAFHRLAESSKLQAVALEWQDAALDQYFRRQPLAKLEAAMAAKRAASGARRHTMPTTRAAAL